MYNRRLFSVRQEYEMPAKKTASKKRKKAPASKKKATAKKASARKKPAASKRKVTKKKTTSRKKVAKKKVAKKKAVSKKKVTKKKVAKKKVAKKKAVSKKKVAKKKVAKKAVSKKKVAKKSVSRKKAPAKAATRKTTSRKKASVKKVTPRRTSVASTAAARRPSKPRSNLLTGPIHGIEPYKPKRGEDYMSTGQLDHFRQILTAWKKELMYEVDRTVHHMQDEAANFPDPNDRATQESEFGLELRTRDRERKLLRKIDSALARIDDGSYGYCDETGEEIGLKRLEARPVATLCLEAQERRELAERQFRDRDDRYR